MQYHPSIKLVLKWLHAIRDWLERNKIFFETITVIFLTIMAIVVSVEANRIASYQTDILKSENLPFVSCVERSNYTSSGYVEQLTIYNAGAPLTEFDCDVLVFYKIMYVQSAGALDIEGRTALIQLSNYYTGGLTHNLAGVGVLVEFSGENYIEANRAKISFCELAWEPINRTSYFPFLIDIEMIKYVNIEYKDIFGETHAETYSVSSSGSRKLSNNEKEIININNKVVLNMSDVSPQSLYEKWLTVDNESLYVETIPIHRVRVGDGVYRYYSMP